MTDSVRHPTPRLRDVMAEQLRFVGLSLRREAAVGGALLLVLLVMFWYQGTVSFSRELGLWFAVLGFVAPLAVWQGLAADGHLWTLPVDHRRHAAVGIAAGWLWLMAAACALLLWMVALILLTGGHFGAEGTRMVLSPSAGAGPVEPRHLITVHWSPPPWLWLVPFTAATVAYLLGSALVLATRHPWRLFGGVALLLGPILFLGRDGVLNRLAIVDAVEIVFTGAPVSQKTTQVLLTTGETMRVWRLPALDHWAAATLLSLGLGIVALWLATMRLDERERHPDDGVRRARA